MPNGALMIVFNNFQRFQNRINLQQVFKMRGEIPSFAQSRISTSPQFDKRPGSNPVRVPVEERLFLPRPPPYLPFVRKKANDHIFVKIQPI